MQRKYTLYLFVVIPLFLLLSTLYARAETVKSQHTGQSPDTLVVNLESAIRGALDSSPEIGAVSAGQAQAEALLRFARASRFAPEFSMTTAHAIGPGLERPDPAIPTSELYLDPDVRNDWSNPRPLNRVGIELVQPIFTWGELSNSINAASYGVEVEVAGVRNKELEIADRTAELYYNLLLTDALFRLTERAGDIVEQAIVEIQRLIDEGDPGVDDADLYQVQITEQEFNRRVIEVTEKQRLARMALARQLLLPEGTVVLAESGVLEPVTLILDSLWTYFELAQKNRPELAQATAGIAAREALVNVARSHYYPKVFFGGSTEAIFLAGRYRQPSPYVSDPYRGRSLQIGLGIRQSLNFAQTKANIEQAEAERNQIRFQRDAAEQLVLFEVEEAYRNYIIARAALEAQDNALTISKQWLRTEQINFDLDLGDTENLVRAVRANLELEASYNETVHEYNISVIRLLKATGILVQQAESGTLVD